MDWLLPILDLTAIPPPSIKIVLELINYLR